MSKFAYDNMVKVIKSDDPLLGDEIGRVEEIKPIGGSFYYKVEFGKNFYAYFPEEDLELVEYVWRNRVMKFIGSVIEYKQVMNRIDFGLGTFLVIDGDHLVGGAALCSDGIVRSLSHSKTRISLSSRVNPAGTKVNRQFISGDIVIETIDGTSKIGKNNPGIVKFDVDVTSKNAKLLVPGCYRIGERVGG